MGGATKGQGIGFELMRPIEEHARFAMRLRSEREVLSFSIHSAPPEWKSFREEFLLGYFHFPDFPPLFILAGGERVGFLRFREIESDLSPRRRAAELSIVIAPEARGKGIGKRALHELSSYALERGIDDLYADVLEGNGRSHRLFKGAGYSELFKGEKSVEEEGKKLPFSRYVKRVTEEELLPKGPSVTLIAEAGSNWRMGSARRDLSMARSLVDAAREAGCDIVKFQCFRENSLYVEKAGSSRYLRDAGIAEEINSLINELSMPKELVEELYSYCRTCGIELLFSAFSEEDFRIVDPFVARHKIASYESSHIHLIRCAAKSGKPTLLSTGASTSDEVAWAVAAYREQGGKELTLLQCTAKYPADLSEMNLLAIPRMRERYRLPVGLSDHSSHPTIAPAAAVALGAAVIEKHFTLSKRLPGPDHAFALEPSELKEMVRAVRLAEEVGGSGVKRPLPCEEELRAFALRGIQALCDIEEGELFREGKNIAILRPGNRPRGIHPKYLPLIEGRRAARPIEGGAGIAFSDWR